MRARPHSIGLVERTGEDVDLVRHLHVLVRERGAATTAEAALNPRRGRVIAALAARKAQRRARHGNPGRHRARRGAAAALAVAVERPARLALVGKGDGAAQAVSGGHFTSSVRMRARTVSPAMRSSPSAIGSEKRRGPALPGLTYSTPSRSSIIGL